MMKMTIRTAGTFWGYHTSVTITTTLGELSIEDNGNIQYEINSNDKPNPATSRVTLFNIARDKTNTIHKGDHIVVRSGATDLFGIVGEGMITKIESNNDDGKDRAVALTFVESKSLKNNTLIAGSNDVTTTRTKGKHPKTKLNLAIKGRHRAITIIRRIAKASGIKIYHLQLSENKLYKRGYTVSARPYSALTKIAHDCNSQIYQRRGKLVIDDYSTDNPYNEHIYFEIGSGLLSEPSVYDKYGNKQCYIMQCFDDPRVQAGSSIEVSSNTINGLHRVQSVKHTHQGNYDMEVVIYE